MVKMLAQSGSSSCSLDILDFFIIKSNKYYHEASSCSDYGLGLVARIDFCAG
jgi:hypothetical protein